jgi:hypothetical protein
MSFQEKTIISFLISGVIVMAGFSYYMFGLHQQGLLAGPDGSMLIARSALALIPVSIVVTIVSTIIVTIVNAIITREDHVETKPDERDRLIELRGMKIAFIAFSAFYIASMGALALGAAPYQVFLIILYAMFASAMIDGAVKLWLYRRGF